MCLNQLHRPYKQTVYMVVCCKLIETCCQILVKKVYGDSSRRARKRQWKLQHLEKIDELDTESVNR